MRPKLSGNNVEYLEQVCYIFLIDLHSAAPRLNDNTVDGKQKVDRIYFGREVTC